MYLGLGRGRSKAESAVRPTRGGDSTEVIHLSPATLIVLVRHSLQGEAVHAAHPQLVVHALAGQGGHVHVEELGLGRGPGQGLAQCSAHVTVGVFPLIAGGCTGELQLRGGGNCFDDGKKTG